MTPTEQALENLRRDVRHNNATEFNANERNSYQHGFDVGYNRCLDDVKNQALTALIEKTPPSSTGLERSPSKRKVAGSIPAGEANFRKETR